MKGVAQTYPVQISTGILPPYSLKLSDYTISDQLFATVLFNDPVRPDLPVKFRLTIEGQGITIQTKQEFQPAPYFLTSGVPEQLTSVDLAEYFNPNNLNFLGVSRAAFNKNARLPEGIYRFCLEVYEYTQNKKVSNTGCATAWLILNDPPIINYPRNFQKIEIKNPQQVFFNWTPRHTGSPNSAFSTEYEFELVEMRAGNNNANNAIQTLPPIYSTTTQQTSLFYGLAETPLIPGQQYAFRVRAKPTIQNEGLDLFKNNGYSEVFTFTYGDQCLEPATIETTPLSAMSFKVNWESAYYHSGFLVRYKENTEDAQWYEATTTESEITIDGLNNDTEYLVTVTGQCNAIFSEKSQEYTAKTKEIEESDFVCGSQESGIDLSNKTPLRSLAPATIITSGNFKILIKEVTSGSNGTFSGNGVAIIPWLKLAGVKVSFKDIQVNEERKVLSGNIRSIQSENSRWVYSPTTVIDQTTTPNNASTSNPTITNPNEEKETTEDTKSTTDSTSIASTTGSGTETANNNSTTTGNTTSTNENGTTNETGGGSSTSSTSGGGSTASGSGSSGGGPSSGGSNANTGGSGSNTNSDTWKPGEGEFGPIRVTYTEAPHKTANSTAQACMYEGKASFKLTLTELNGVSAPVDFTNVTIQYTLDCGDSSLISAAFTWKNDNHITLVPFGMISGEVSTLSLAINNKKEVSGSVAIKAELLEDVRLSDLPTEEDIKKPLDIVLRKGLKGACGFTINASSEKIEGKWDFSLMSGLNLDLTHEEEIIAQLKNGSFNQQGLASGILIG